MGRQTLHTPANILTRVVFINEDGNALVDAAVVNAAVALVIIGGSAAGCQS